MTNSTTADGQIQESIFSYLSDPATHPLVRRIDTHAATVFLEGDRALKIKRAVRFPFLDYSTLAKRKTACDEEVKINQHFAPQIYRRVVPITRSEDGSLHVDGPGKPVEFAIEMARFDESRTIDHLAEAGSLNPDLVYAMADTIAACHVVAPLAAAQPWVDSITSIINGNITALRNAGCFPANEIDDLLKNSHSAFCGVRKLLERRARLGYVRRCHGDLHLANIVVIGNKPVLFDAIEFDPVIASIDVCYDLAFVIMDLLRYGRQQAANSLLNRYLDVTSAENLDALAALPLFMSMRAAIRAHVLLARSPPAGSGKTDIIEAARSYFDLARRLIQPPAPALVAIGGLSGTGKSVLARAIAPLVGPAPGAIVMRSDRLRKDLFQIDETERLPASAYQPEISRQIYDALVQRAVRILSRGHSVVADAVFASEAERAAIRDAARKENVRFVGLFLVADLATRQSRIARRKHDVSDATPEVAALQEEYAIGTVDWAAVNAAGTPEQTLNQCQSHFTDRGAVQKR